MAEAGPVSSTRTVRLSVLGGATSCGTLVAVPDTVRFGRFFKAKAFSFVELRVARHQSVCVGPVALVNNACAACFNANAYDIDLQAGTEYRKCLDLSANFKLAGGRGAGAPPRQPARGRHRGPEKDQARASCCCALAPDHDGRSRRVSYLHASSAPYGNYSRRLSHSQTSILKGRPPKATVAALRSSPRRRRPQTGSARQWGAG